MSLSKELKGVSVVIAARNFNPSIFTQQWLTDKNVIDNTANEGQQIFIPQFVHVDSPNFRLTILQEQLMFEIVNSDGGAYADIITNKLGPIVAALAETPVVAVGINFQWHMGVLEQSVGDTSKSLFDKGTGVYELFSSNDARYGAYMSKDFMNARLKLDIKPACEQDNQGSNIGTEFILCAFNFHRDLRSAEKSSELLEMIQNFDAFLTESERIVSAL